MDIKLAQYAVLMFDKERKAFKLIPVNRHILFEKKRNQQPV